MNSQFNLLIVSILIACSFLVLSFRKSSLTESRLKPISDSIAFVPNTADGWDLISVYLDQHSADSVQFELIVQHRKLKNRIDEQYLGSITDNSFFPKRRQQYTYYLLGDNIWNIRVDTDGKCYLKHVSGRKLKENPFIIPFKMRYRNKN